MCQIVKKTVFIILAFQLCEAFNFNNEISQRGKFHHVRMVVEQPSTTDETISTFECTETETETSETTRTWHQDVRAEEEDDIKKRCPRYRLPELKYNQTTLLNVWQTFYYQLPDEIRCFKMFIRRVTKEEKRQYFKKYGNFDGKVDWDKCHMEVKSATVNKRKHFLQGEPSDAGVLDNIIIEEDKSKHNKGRHQLVEESADQWLNIKNMLLMRDCDTGGIVVFARVPTIPIRNDLDEALRDFGERKGKKGKMACEEKETTRNFDEEDTASTDL